MLPKFHCLRCGYDWTPRIEGRPKACPGCKQTRWDQPPGKRGRKAKPISATETGKRKAR